MKLKYFWSCIWISYKDIMRRPQNLKKISHLFWQNNRFYSVASKQVEEDFFQIFVAFSEKLNFTKIVLTYCEKTFEIRGWRPRICKMFEITRIQTVKGQNNFW